GPVQRGLEHRRLAGDGEGRRGARAVRGGVDLNEGAQGVGVAARDRGGWGSRAGIGGAVGTPFARSRTGVVEPRAPCTVNTSCWAASSDGGAAVRSTVIAPAGLARGPRRAAPAGHGLR